MSHDKANQSEVGEGPKAVDAALRRFVREAEALETETPKTETPEAEATSDIESVEALLGDLELGADEATSTVVETIGELDDAAEDAAKTLELAIAEITKLGETDPKAADAALQRIAHARKAREAEALAGDGRSNAFGLLAVGQRCRGEGVKAAVIVPLGGDQIRPFLFREDDGKRLKRQSGFIGNQFIKSTDDVDSKDCHSCSR